MGSTLVGSLFGISILYVFYRAVQSEWPDSYFTLADSGRGSGLEYAIIASPLRYFTFRFLPVYLVCVFVAVSLDRDDTNAVLAVVTICAAHAASNNGRAVVRLFRENEGTRHRPLLIMHVVVAIGVAATGAAALFTRNWFDQFVPTLNEMGATLWTAAFAGVIGAYILATSRVDRSLQKALAASRSAIPTRLFELARQEALAHGSDPHLVQAIMIVENMQRPRWFRQLEAIKGIAFKRGTYGIMQVESDGPISDEESIRRAVRGRLAGVVAPLSPQPSGGRPFVNYEALKRLALDYNPSSSYADAVRDTYISIRP